MPGPKETYTYEHLLRFGQTLLASSVVTLALSLISVVRGEPLDLTLYLDLILVLTIVLYALNYSHMFNGGLVVGEDEIRNSRLVLHDQVCSKEEIRRIQFVALPARFTTLLTGSRLRMTVVCSLQEDNLVVEVSDLRHSQDFIDAVETFAAEHDLPVRWQNEKGEFLSAESDQQQISL
ncbi:hypothetical protein [Lewinella sp. IMCC34191]|uniref:hypothetical protein n=1 Tax=Lewinella sp. IMCC34191 TaxID=2259172 RepID=UPI000E289513|nr:hypothetical protein [Lewinella sp. IMCC34191]